MAMDLYIQTPITTTANTASSNNTTSTESGKGVPNPLHNYASYTYGISLHALTVGDYKSLTDGQPGSFKPSKTLISTASRYKTERDAAFQEDFYFDDFKMETVIGMNSGTQGTNGIQIQFTVIEPYGLTLLNRLLDISVQELDAKNYLDIPYLLEINFFGTTDDGKMEEVPGQTKWIPIKILDFKIKAGTKGSEYQILSIPYNHVAFTESIQSTPANFEVTAKTVGEFFSSQLLSTADQASINKAFISANPQATSDSARTKPAAGTPATPSSNNSLGNGTTAPSPTDVRQAASAAKPIGETNTVPTSAPIINSKSYTAAYNAWQEQAKKTRALEVPNQIEFIIDDTIANSLIVYKRKNTSDRTPNQKTPTLQSQNAQAATPPTGPDFTRSLFNVNAGDSIVSIVNQVLQNSEYIINQIKDPTKNNNVDQNTVGKDGKKIKWFKIIPKIEFLDFDTRRNKWAKKIIYHIKPYDYNNTKDARANQSSPTSYAKEYNYIYTSKNIDIIDFEIDFNTLYYTAIYSDLAKTEALNKSEDTTGANADNNTASSRAQNTITPTQGVPISGQMGVTGMNKWTDSSKIQAASVAQSFYSAPRGDMLNLKLKIVGDPHFIKQDDLYVHPSTPGGDGDVSQNNGIDARTGSLIMDAGEIYAYVRFRTPVDIDESTGLYRFGLTSQKTGKTVESYFGGYYRIMTVTSEMRGGQFTQTIDLIRQFDQQQDTKSNSSNSPASIDSVAQRTDPNPALDNKTNPAVKDNNIQLQLKNEY